MPWELFAPSLPADCLDHGDENGDDCLGDDLVVKCFELSGKQSNII